MAKNKFLVLLGAVLLMTNLVQAQESTNASGTNATGNGGAVAYSVGQIVYTVHAGTSGSVAQGVQQAYEISVVGIEEMPFDITVSLFPNPATNNLTLQTNNYLNEKLQYRMYDMQGKLLKSGKITARQTSININNLPSATYLIDILNQESKKVQSFKIIKN